MIGGTISAEVDAVAQVCGVDDLRAGVEVGSGRERRGVEEDSAAIILRKSSGCLSQRFVNIAPRERKRRTNEEVSGFDQGCNLDGGGEPRVMNEELEGEVVPFCCCCCPTILPFVFDPPFVIVTFRVVGVVEGEGVEESSKKSSISNGASSLNGCSAGEGFGDRLAPILGDIAGEITGDLPPSFPLANLNFLSPPVGLAISCSVNQMACFSINSLTRNPEREIGIFSA